MAWEHLSVTKPHLVYIILGGFTSIFMLVSSIIKERAYIGEATVATLCGVIFGPHAANLINPLEWGNVDIVTIEFSRIVLVVQCFAVGVELPKFYMERHWKSVVYLLVPVMTFGWLITSVFIWWMVPRLNWLESLVVAACVTATDPVLASSVVGKGKFAKRIPKHLRDVLSAESGCNDGMAFPFIYLSLYLIEYHRKAGPVTFHFACYTILYECVFGAFYGFMVGYLARHAIKYAEEHDFIDRESFLAFYFVLGLFCAGSGSIIGVDDLLVGFSAGVGFSNDGWFAEKTEESHVSNVIDLLLNLSYFVYLGTIIPWGMYNDAAIGLTAWRLCIIAIFVILFRRIPIMLALKPVIPDVKTWREALFAGHFGPIGVGAIFVALLARGELQGNGAIPLSKLPDREGEQGEHHDLILLVWPIVTFLVISSIVVHGSSIAVFTLGKNITTMRITLSYTAAFEDGPSWMNRLPRIASQSKSQARTMSDTDGEELKMPEMPPGTLPPIGIPRNFLRRQKEESSSRNGSRASSLVSRRRKAKKWDEGIGPGGPIADSAIYPVRQAESPVLSPAVEKKDQFPFPDSQSSTLDSLKEKEPEVVESIAQVTPRGRQRGPEVNIYEDGDNLVIESKDGNVLHVVPSPGLLSPPRHRSLSLSAERSPSPRTHLEMPGQQTVGNLPEKFDWTVDSIKKKCVEVYRQEVDKRKGKAKGDRKHEAACAYQFGNTIIVEDADGEVLKIYELPHGDAEEAPHHDRRKYMGMGAFTKTGQNQAAAKAPEIQVQGSKSSQVPPSGGESSRPPASGKPSGLWNASFGFGKLNPTEAVAERQRKKSVLAEEQEEDDKHIRFTIGGVGRRMNKADFMKEMQHLETQTRHRVVDGSSASHAVKTLAKMDPPPRGSSSAQTAVKDGNVGKDSSTDTSHGGRGASTTDRPPVASSSRRRVVASSSTAVEDDTGETPAERRRREAALGMTSQGDDSEDEGTPRVPPSGTRNIRFADTPERGRKQ